MAGGLRQALRSPRNRLLAWAGIYAARDRLSPQAIAERLGEGITAAEIEAMFAAAGLDPFKPLPPDFELVTISLPARLRTKLAAESSSRGLMMPDLAGAVLASVTRDDLFRAVLDS